MVDSYSIESTSNHGFWDRADANGPRERIMREYDRARRLGHDERGSIQDAANRIDLPI